MPCLGGNGRHEFGAVPAAMLHRAAVCLFLNRQAPAALVLDFRSRLQNAGPDVSDINLKGGMVYPKAVNETVADSGEKLVAGMAARNDQMGGERIFRRAHGPDVQIMHAANARQHLEKAADLG